MPGASTSGKAERGAQRKIELFSGTYFGACTLGGIIACGPTHTMVTPLDLVCSHVCGFVKAFPELSGQLTSRQLLGE